MDTNANKVYYIMQTSTNPQETRRNQTQLQDASASSFHLAGHQYMNYNNETLDAAHYQYINSTGQYLNYSGQNFITNPDAHNQLQFYMNYNDNSLSGDCYNISQTTAPRAASVPSAGSGIWGSVDKAQTSTQSISSCNNNNTLQYNLNNYPSVSHATHNPSDWLTSPLAGCYMTGIDEAAYITKPSPPMGAQAGYLLDGGHQGDRDAESSSDASLLPFQDSGYSGRSSAASTLSGLESQFYGMDVLQQVCSTVGLDTGFQSGSIPVRYQSEGGCTMGYRQIQPKQEVLTEQAVTMNKSFDAIKKECDSSLPKPGKTRTKERCRNVYTEVQKAVMEKEYLLTPYVSVERKAELALAIGLSDRQVKFWFQNRRAKGQKLKRRMDKNNVSV